MKSYLLNRLSILLFISILFAGFSFAQAPNKSVGYDKDMSAHYKIYDVKNKQLIDLSQLIQQVNPIDVLFFGEEHNDSTAHHLQLQIYKALSQANPSKIALSLEMFQTDVQPIMNEYLLGLISEKNFTKEARVWNNYKDYKPLIEYAKQNKLPVIAANAATRYSNAVTKDGLDVLSKLPKSSLQFLPKLPIDTASGAYYDKFIDLLGGHSMGPMKVYQSQNLWDATMAWSISQFHKANKTIKVFHLNGRFHSDEKLGTYAQLKKYAPKLKTANISCFSANDYANPNWESYSKLGDFIIVTDPKVKKTY